MQQKKEYPTHMEIIEALKKRFPCNNSASWGRNSDKQLKEWYDEYIRV